MRGSAAPGAPYHHPIVIITDLHNIELAII